MIQRRTQTEAYWQEKFDVISEDASYIYDLILDQGAPVGTDFLAQAMIERRCRQEEETIHAELSRGPVYQPKNEYEVGQPAIFPALDYVLGTIVGTRQGRNPEYGEFTVIQVEIEGEEEVREWAVAALEDLGAPPVANLHALASLLGDQNADVGYWTATLLGRLGADAAPAVPTLANALSTSSYSAVCQRVAWALGRIGPAAASALDALRQASAGDDPRNCRFDLRSVHLELRRPTIYVCIGWGRESYQSGLSHLHTTTSASGRFSTLDRFWLSQSSRPRARIDRNVL